MSEEKKDFVVKDRRIFSQDSPEQEKQADGQATEPTTEGTAKAGKPTGAPAADDSSQPPPPLPEINFPTFIASLNASALLHLGAIEDPTTGKKEKNLLMAKQTIDILSMLEEKTAGNLTPDEANLIKNILYDLRIMYVKEKG